MNHRHAGSDQHDDGTDQDDRPCPMELEDERAWNRRGFLGITGAITGALAWAGLWKGGQSEAEAAGRRRAEIPEAKKPEGFEPLKLPGKIAQITHPKAMINMRKLNAPIVEQMVNQALMDLTGTSSPVLAIGKFIHKDDIVGLHPNCLGSPHMGANPTVTFTLVKALLELGVPEKNILIYDQYGGRMKAVGYKLSKKPGGIRIVTHGMLGGYDLKPALMLNKKPVRLCKLLHGVSAIINIPVPKDHDLAGVTGALKNMAFGNIQRVPQFHRGIHKNIADIYNLPQIKDKTRLTVTDALRCLYQGGPQDRGPHKALNNMIMASTDPVTTDVAILEIVNRHRVAKKMKPLEEVKFPRKRPPQSIEEAAQLGLGVADRAKIEWLKKELS